MKNFFEPKTIAIIGASNHKEKVGYSLMSNLKKFKGTAIPINLHEKKVLGKKCYKSVLNFPEKMDLAIIAIPAKFVIKVLNECGKKEIKNIIIISAGFSEIGNKKLENELRKIIKKYKISLLGPNCFGVVNPYLNLDTTFAISTPKKGDIAFISQSGALWSAIADWSLTENIGFSAFASLGNMADIDFSDLIEYFNKNKNTKVIVLYMEYIKDGRRFMEIAKKCKKKIIAIKAGETEAGKEATLSHTGSLAGQYEIYKAAFKQSNVKLADTITQAFDMARIKEKIKGNKVIIISNAGGPGALAADYLTEKNFKVVKLPKSFIKKIKLELWSKRNPIDIVGDARAKDYKEIFDKLAKEKFFDILIVILTPQKMTEIEKSALELIKLKEKINKTIIACWMGGNAIKKTKDLLERNNIPCYFELKRAVDALA